MKNLLARPMRPMRLFPVLLAVGLLTATPGLAQPGGGGPGEQNGGPGGGNRGDRAAMQAQRLQQQLQSAGYTDQALLMHLHRRCWRM